MFDNLEIFRLSGAMAAHAGARQAVVARNMANADTPGYGAQDLPSFQSLVASRSGGFGLRATRPGHLGAGAGTVEIAPRTLPELAAEPNGNTVSLESEMLRGVDVRRQHNRALAIYGFARDLLRLSVAQR